MKKTAAKKKVVAKKKPAPKSKVAKKQAPKTKVAAKKPAKPTRPPPPPPDALLERPVHPKLTWLLANLASGRHAGGLLQMSPPGIHAVQLEDWLMGNTAGRTSIGRTAFGELLVFRDLRDKAQELGMPDAELACDMAAVDIHFKKMKVLATSAEEFVELLGDDEWQRAFLRKSIYDAARARVGDWGSTECFCFVPALALGGSEDAASVECVDWHVHQALLLQI